MSRIEPENVIKMSEVHPFARYPVLSMVEAYWTALKGTRRAPARSEIDPVRIEDALDYAFILEHVAPGVFRFRLAGSHLNELMGMEVRGMAITSMFSPTSRMMASQHFESVFQDGRPVEMRLQSAPDDRNSSLAAQLLVLPLQSDFGELTRALGVFASRGPIGQTPRRFDCVEQFASNTAGIQKDTTNAFAEPPARFDHAIKKPNDGRPALRLVWNGEDPV